MRGSERSIKNFNILSASACLSASGLFMYVPAITTGLPMWLVIASGIMVGAGFGMAYLGLQWENKTSLNVALAVSAAILSAVSVTVSLLAIQGNLWSLNN